jgi:hypothetical protein
MAKEKGEENKYALSALPRKKRAIELAGTWSRAAIPEFDSDLGE